MVPAAYVRLKRLPLTSNGKLDRKALPCPEAEAYSALVYEPPQGEIETAVAAVWAEALKVERIGRRDHFFDLGGHSLLAVSVTTRLQQTLNVEIGIRELFAHPVLADLAEIVKSATHSQHVPILRARRKERHAVVASGKITATGSDGHKIASDDNGRSWYDLQTGKAIQ
jgi:acyl carrier protein